MRFVFPYFNQILAILSATSTSTKITFNNIINHFNYLKNFGTRNLTSSTNQGHLSMQLASIDLFVSPFIWPGFRLAGGGRNGGIPFTTGKIGLPPISLPLLCQKNIDFVIFMQFLAIFPKLPPPISRPHLGKPVDYPQFQSPSLKS